MNALPLCLPGLVLKQPSLPTAMKPRIRLNAKGEIVAVTIISPVLPWDERVSSYVHGEREASHG